VEDIDFLKWILLLETQKNLKIWVWKEKSVEPLINVFTLGPMAQGYTSLHKV
jgi:hypothetical protein